MADNKDTQYQGTNAHSSSDNASNNNNSNTQGAENTNTNAFGYTPFANFPFGNNAFDFGSNPFNNFGTNAFNLPQNPLDFWVKPIHLLTWPLVFRLTIPVGEFYSEFFGNMTKLSQQIAQQSMRANQAPQYTNTSIMMDLMDGWRKMGQMVTNHPGTMVEDQLQLFKDQMHLWQNTLQQFAGKKSTQWRSPEKGDKTV